MRQLALKTIGLVGMLSGVSPVAAALGAEPADSVRTVYPLPVVEVTTLPPDSVAAGESMTTLLTSRPLRERSRPTVAAAAPLMPSTRAGVNSRGETQFMVRGASERHLRVSMDGIPLNLAWDERTDLSLLPAEILDGITARRGVWTLLSGPGALAGSLELHGRRPAHGGETVVDMGAGEFGAHRLALLHGRRWGRWALLGALAYHGRDAWPLPAEHGILRHQTGGRERVNSDHARLSPFLTLERTLAGGGHWRLLIAGSDARRGVPPEGHRDRPRFWRYTAIERGLAGLSVSLPVGPEKRWRLNANAAFDQAGQEIRVYSDSTYTGPALDPGTDHETDRARALHGRIALEGDLGGRVRWAFAARLRDAEHAERLVVDGAEESYRQRLASETAEFDFDLGLGWRLRTGLSWLQASTPASGPHAARSPDGATDWLLALRRPSSSREPMEFRAALSRRSRFPALRELYSGALGQFIVNPDLGPERQDLFELGVAHHGRRLSADLSLFVAYLEGGIEKTAVSDSTFRRVNAEALRSMGVELELALALGRGLRVGGHWLHLRARRQEDGVYGLPAEDRPDYQGTLYLSWERGGFRLSGEAERIGPRHSADVTAPSGLRELSAQDRVNLQVAWRRYLNLGPLNDAELRLRVDNLADALVESQTGLPEPGRSFGLGLRLGLDL